MEKLLYVLLGFALGVATFLLNEWVKDRRKRAGLLEVLTWQIEAFKAACEWAAEHKLYDSTQVEKLAEFIQQGYLRQPDLVLAVPRGETRRALSDLYLEVCGMLALLEMHRKQVAAGEAAKALNADNYVGIALRCGKLLDRTAPILKNLRWIA